MRMQHLREISRRAYIPFVTVLIIVSAFSIYYFFYVSSRRAYVTSRDYRVLAVMSSQIKAKIENLPTILTFWKEITPERLRQLAPDTRDKREYIQRLVPDFKEIFPSTGDAFVPELAHLMPGALPLPKLIHRLTRNDVFDDVILVNSEGRVVYQYSGATPALDISSLSLKSGASLTMGTLRGSATPLDVVDAGIVYKLFPRPIVFEIPPEEPAEWVLCGLVRADTFRSETLTISYNKIILLLFLVSMVALSWPFFRVWIMSPRDRLRRADAAFMVSAGLTAVSFGTLFFLHLYSDAELQAANDSHLKGFASDIRQNLFSEIRNIHSQLKAFHKSEVFQRDLCSAAGNSSYRRARTSIFKPPYHVSDDAYPGLDTAFWADPSGAQRIKYTPRTLTTPFLDVSTRTYFQSVLRGETWTLKDIDGGGFPFYLQPAYSRATGERIAILATPFRESAARAGCGDSRLAIGAILTRLRSVSGTALPLGFGYAILASDGRVLFHSEEARALQENFFDECDKRDRLQSAVRTRTADYLDTRYFGRDHRLYITPLSGLPWTLVVFSDKNVLQTTSLETLTLASILTLLYGSLFLLQFGLASIFSVRRLARYVWPDEARTHCYSWLILLYVACLVLFIYQIARGQPSGLLLHYAFVLPFLTLLLSVILLVFLSPGPRPTAFFLLQLPFSAPLVIVLGVHWWFSAVSSVSLPSVLAAVAVLISVLLSLRVYKQGFFPPRKMQKKEKRSWAKVLDNPLRLIGLSTYRRRFLTAVFLLVLLVCAFPSYVFFQTAHASEAELLVRNTQFHLLERVAARQDPGGGPADVYDRFFYGTTVVTAPSPQGPQLEEFAPQRALIRFLGAVRPPYNSLVAESRSLVNDWAEDHSWRFRFLRSRPENRVSLSSSALGLQATSSLPALGAGRSESMALTIMAFVLAGVVVIAAFFYASIVARRVFLLNFIQPLGVAAERLSKLAAGAGKRLLVLGRPLSNKSRQIKEGNYYPMSFKKLKDASVPDPEDLEGKAIAIDHFEDVIDLQDFDDELDGLEGVLEDARHHGRSVVVVSSVDPLFYFSHGGHVSEAVAEERTKPVRSLDRLAGIFSQFAHKHHKEEERDEDFQSALDEARERLRTTDTGLTEIWKSGVHRRRTASRALDTLQEECAGNSYLQKLANETGLISSIEEGKLHEDQVPFEVARRARPYYRQLWRTCSADEKLALFQLARNSLINPNSHPVIRELLRKRLILEPDFRPMNESFRLFVRGVHDAPGLLMMEQQAASIGWQRFKTPLLILLIGAVSFLVLTQQELRQSGIAYISALAALISALIELFGLAGGAPRAAVGGEESS